jgi:hypothetical protein
MINSTICLASSMILNQYLYKDITDNKVDLLWRYLNNIKFILWIAWISYHRKIKIIELKQKIVIF